jgi:hypothetical protein
MPRKAPADPTKTFQASMTFESSEDPVLRALREGYEVTPHLKISGKDLCAYALRLLVCAEKGAASATASASTTKAPAVEHKREEAPEQSRPRMRNLGPAVGVRPQEQEG